MRTQEIIKAAARLRTVSVKAADYASLQALDSAMQHNDANIVKFGDDWLVSTGNGLAIKVKRNQVKPVVAALLDKLGTGQATAYHLPAIDRTWDKELLRETAERILLMGPPTTGASVGSLMAAVENLVES